MVSIHRQQGVLANILMLVLLFKFYLILIMAANLDDRPMCDRLVIRRHDPQIASSLWIGRFPSDPSRAGEYSP